MSEEYEASPRELARERLLAKLDTFSYEEWHKIMTRPRRSDARGWGEATAHTVRAILLGARPDSDGLVPTRRLGASTPPDERELLLALESLDGLTWFRVLDRALQNVRTFRAQDAGKASVDALRQLLVDLWARSARQAGRTDVL